MQIRCTVQLGDSRRKLLLVSKENETLEHLALKLAGFVLFFDKNPRVEIRSKNPALENAGFKPDLLSLDSSGSIQLWVECGNVTTHKLDKLLRRQRDARIVVLKGTLRETKNLRAALEKNKVNNSERIEIWGFPDGEFKRWLAAMDESVEIVGEIAERGFNLVANGSVFNFEFENN